MDSLELDKGQNLLKQGRRTKILKMRPTEFYSSKVTTISDSPIMILNPTSTEQKSEENYSCFQSKGESMKRLYRLGLEVN